MVIALMWLGGSPIATAIDCPPPIASADRAANRRTPELIARRTDADRLMRHDDAVVQQALTVLGQAVSPIKVVGADEMREIYRRAGVGLPAVGVHAFRAPADSTDANIYVNKDSLVYRSAVLKPSALAVLKLAATLVHEQVHDTDGEFAAYRLQSDFVRSKLPGMPWRDQAEATRHVEQLDARARASAWAERRRGLLLRVEHAILAPPCLIPPGS